MRACKDAHDDQIDDQRKRRCARKYKPARAENGKWQTSPEIIKEILVFSPKSKPLLATLLIVKYDLLLLFWMAVCDTVTRISTVTWAHALAQCKLRAVSPEINHLEFENLETKKYVVKKGFLRTSHERHRWIANAGFCYGAYFEWKREDKCFLYWCWWTHNIGHCESLIIGALCARMSVYTYLAPPYGPLSAYAHTLTHSDW